MEEKEQPKEKPKITRQSLRHSELQHFVTALDNDRMLLAKRLTELCGITSDEVCVHAALQNKNFARAHRFASQLGFPTQVIMHLIQGINPPQSSDLIVLIQNIMRAYKGIDYFICDRQQKPLINYIFKSPSSIHVTFITFAPELAVRSFARMQQERIDTLEDSISESQKEINNLSSEIEQLKK